MKKLNKTIARFTYKGKKYEIDQLLDTKEEWPASTPWFTYDVFLIDGKSSEQVAQFEGYEGVDYIQRAKERISDTEK